MDLSYFLTSKNRVNSQRVKRDWLLKNQPEFLKVLESKYDEDLRTVEKIWLFFNNLTKRPLCSNCSTKPTKFLGLLHGYGAYCSTSCSNSSASVKLKKQEACINKFGVDNPYKAESCKKKIRETNVLRYRTDNFAKTEMYKVKAIETNRKKRGVDWVLSANSPERKNMNERNRDEFERKCTAFGAKMISWNNKKFGIVTLKCANDHEYQINKWTAFQRMINNIDPCTVCKPLFSTSSTKPEKILQDWLTEANIKFETNVRGILPENKEIDIFIPGKKIAIEVNGAYWHSDLKKDRSYHFEKTNAADALGIELIHVWEDQLVTKPEIVKSLILSKLGITDRKINARQCNVVKVSSKDAFVFFEKNHMQGAISSFVHYGLVNDNELVCVMSFGKLRKAVGQKHSDGIWEMYRFANRLGYRTIGGASKLLSAFIREFSPKTIMSYAARDYSVGSMYEKLGFKKIKITGPGYWYVSEIDLTRYHRFSFRKDKLVKDGYDSTKTEFEIMDELKYLRVWDSGQLVFERTFAK